MDGYRWEGDEDDYEVVHSGRATVRNNEGGQRSAESGREEEESPGNDDDAGHNHHVEDAEHDHVEDQDEDEDAEDDGDGPSSMDWVQDPHLQELLLNQASNNARAAAREKVKLNQLEIIVVTPLYEGCNPEDTRLKVAHMALEMKVKHKMTETCFDENMTFLQERLPKGNTCPTSFNEAKKTVCSLDLLHVRYHVCINDCIIYRQEYTESTVCPKCGVSR